MTNNRWVANKFGLVNFWYYDNQEYKLLDGKVIFRGSNGSGKSVTTQSFIPLLLDGDKRASRIDPFGTTSRKLENYLLMDEGEEDRTAYLYLEFKKGENYLTLGMGLRARKGKKLDSWYFILKDGRRIGKDFSLYQDKSNQTLITNAKLKNELKDANYYGEAQKEYMKKVNEHLYGYSDIDDYKDLLNLLIELRSPKLSKDFKPTKMYEILNKSLSTLSEDDLFDMSEAMENMDSLKNNLDQKILALDSSKKIEKAFNEYNHAVIFNKAKKLIESEKNKNKSLKDLEQLRLENITSNDKRNININTIAEMNNTLTSAIVEKDSLNQNDVFKIKNDLKAINDNINTTNSRLLEKKDKLKGKYNRKLEIEKFINENEYKIEKIKSEIQELLDEEQELKSEIYFEYSWNLINDIYKEEFNIKGFVDNFERYSCLVDHLYELIFYYNNAKETKQIKEDNYYTKDREYNMEKRKYNESLEYLTNIKSEYVDRISEFLEKSDQLKLDEKEILSVFATIQKIKGIADLYQVSDLLKDIFRSKEQEYNTKLNDVSREKTLILNNIEKLNIELLELDELEEKFETDEKIANLKNILTLNNIEYLEFYKTINFKNNIVQETKNGLESALFNMGYIEALFIPNQYKDRVESLVIANDYRIVFKADNIQKLNIEGYFNIEDNEFSIKYSDEIRSVLQSISFNAKSSEVFINSDYSYKINSLNVSYKNSYESKYIGADERKRYLEKQKQLLRDNILKQEEEKKLIEKEESEIKITLDKFIEEKRVFPSYEDIRESIDMINKQLSELQKKEIDKNIASEENFKAKRQYEEIKTRFYSEKEGIKIPADLKVYENVKKSIVNYRDIIRDIKDKLNENQNNTDKNKEFKNNLEFIVDNIDELEFEISEIDRNLSSLTSTKLGFEKTLDTFNIGDIEKKLDELTVIINEYPSKILKLEKSSSVLDERINTNNQNILELENKYRLLEMIYKAALEVFSKEKKLLYIDEINEMDNLSSAKFIIKTFDNSLYLKQNDKLSKLFEVISKNEGALIEYNLRREIIFNDFEATTIDEVDVVLEESSRTNLQMKFESSFVNIKKFNILLEQRVEAIKLLISEEERKTLEDTLIKTLSTKITAKIYNTSKWINNINSLMNNLQTSNGLKLSLVWKAKTAENEDELNSKELTDILNKSDFMSDEQREKVVRHFKTKLKNTKRRAVDNGDNKSYQNIIKEVLDYRQWYEFKLEYSMKNQERKKELTDNGFFRLSGGEKAMAMYIPLFAAVNSRYDRGNKECPKIIALDEAFAGIDEENISGIFKLLEELSLDYVLNSQVLWGTYKTVKNLAIYEIIREGDDVVVPIKYTWNGNIKTMEI